MSRAYSSRSHILYGLSGKFKLDICGLRGRSNIIHLNTMKTDIASVLVDFTPLLYHFNHSAGDLYYKDKVRFIEMQNESEVITSITQDGDTNEIETHEANLSPPFSSMVIAVGSQR